MTNVIFLDLFIAETGKNEFPVLTVQQPYASMLISGHKRTEYRNWRIPDIHKDKWVLIHAGSKTKGDLFNIKDLEWEDFCIEYPKELPENAIIGAVKFGTAVDTNYVKYKFAWPVTDMVQFIPEIPDIKGKLRFWKYKIDLPTHINQQIN